MKETVNHVSIAIPNDLISRFMRGVVAILSEGSFRDKICVCLPPGTLSTEVLLWLSLALNTQIADTSTAICWCQI
jgi:hypothetical protein